MEMSVNKAFGGVLSYYRRAKGLSQEDFEGAAHRTYMSDLERGQKSPTLETIARLAEKLHVHPTELMAHTFASLQTGSMESLVPPVTYLSNSSRSADFSYTHTGRRFAPEEVEAAVSLTNIEISSFALIFQQVVGTDLFTVIDKKQTGAFLGAIFVWQLADVASGHLAKNPSQTGHPDLIPREYLEDESITNWDQFPYGGVEVKTSSGDLRSGMSRYLSIGQPRISHVTNVVWKGHHQEINNLLGLFWDYFNGRPTILAAFYSNQLVPSDFTNTVPRPGGGHTTSVCITKVSAREKLMRNWVLLPKEPEYLRLFGKFGASL